jgi:hypothetical protein
VEISILLIHLVLRWDLYVHHASPTFIRRQAHSLSYLRKQEVTKGNSNGCRHDGDCSFGQEQSFQNALQVDVMKQGPHNKRPTELQTTNGRTNRASPITALHQG